jgi:hypothetical protein
MDRRELLTTTAATVTAGALSGCLGLGKNDPSRLDLTVRNDGGAPVDVDVVVRGDDGTIYQETSERVDIGVAREFEATVGETGRHEVTVTGDGWEGRLAWDAAVCALFAGTIVADTARIVAVASECVDPR